MIDKDDARACAVYGTQNVIGYYCNTLGEGRVVRKFMSILLIYQ